MLISQNILIKLISIRCPNGCFMFSLYVGPNNENHKVPQSPLTREMINRDWRIFCVVRTFLFNFFFFSFASWLIFFDNFVRRFMIFSCFKILRIRKKTKNFDERFKFFFPPAKGFDARRRTMLVFMGNWINSWCLMEFSFEPTFYFFSSFFSLHNFSHKQNGKMRARERKAERFFSKEIQQAFSLFSDSSLNTPELNSHTQFSWNFTWSNTKKYY